MTTKAVLLLLLIGVHATLFDVKSLLEMNTEDFGCDQSKMYDAEEGLQKLSEAMTLVQSGRLDQDIKELREIQMLAQYGINQQATNFAEMSNLQFEYMIKHKFMGLALIQMPTLARPETEKLKAQINLVLASSDVQTKRTCCEMLNQMIELLLADLLEMEEQCSHPITINIEGEIRKIQILRGDCDQTLVDPVKGEVIHIEPPALPTEKPIAPPKPQDPKKTPEKQKTPDHKETDKPKSGEQPKTPEKQITPDQKETDKPKPGETEKTPEKQKTPDHKETDKPKSGEQPKTPEKQKTPDHKETDKPKPGETEKTPKKQKTPDHKETDKPKPGEPEKTPDHKETDKPTKTPEKQKTPDHKEADKPKPGQPEKTPDHKESDKPTKTPEKQKTPEHKDPDHPTKTPEKQKTPDQKEAPKDPDHPEKAKTPEKQTTPADKHKTSEKAKTPDPNSKNQEEHKEKLPTPAKPKTPTPKAKTPVKAKSPSPLPTIECTNGIDQVVDSSLIGEAIADTDIGAADIQGATDYGHGFWVRYLSRYPEEVLKREKGQFYFISRLTSNPELSDTKFGDRTLAIWHADDGFLFATVDIVTKNPSVQKTIAAQDIEGQWTYLYFGYSLRLKRATAFVKVGEHSIHSVQISATHQVPNYLRMIIGGRHLEFPGFNGQFAKPVFKIGEGAYSDTETELHDYMLKCNPVPLPTCAKETILKVIGGTSRFKETADPVKEFKTHHENTFAEEYSAAGWFKWSQPLEQQKWHIAFRVFITKENKNAAQLGDRALSLWMGQGALAFATYTYDDIFGAGNPNVHNSIAHKDQHTHWMFVYFGYSHQLRQAHAYIKFTNVKEDRTFENLNHYLVPRLKVIVAKDQFYASWSGYIAHFKIITCHGAYNPQFPIPDQPALPSQTPLITPPKVKSTTPPPTPEIHPPKLLTLKPRKTPTAIVPPDHDIFKTTPPPQIQKKCIQGIEEIADSSSAHEVAPIADIKVPYQSLKGLKEFGYGFWSRWLTRYPEPLLHGNQEPWYFISRLTSNEKYADNGVGDRLLAIFLGKEGYTFFTQDQDKAEPESKGKIEYTDIEGVWTYIYFSYNPTSHKAVAFLHTDKSTRHIELDSVLQAPNTLRFILGGNDLDQYPGFNGQFSRPVLRIGPGSFLGTEEELNKFSLACNPLPPLECAKPTNSKLLTGIEHFERKQTEIHQFVADNNSLFPTEYSIGGWFLWKETQQEAWHLAFRVTLNGQKVNKNAELLGDRDLSAWLGTNDGGAYHVATYSYSNMFGQGQTSAYSSLKHHSKHTQWHYIYFAYNREQRSAFASVHFVDSKETYKFVKTNHYLAPIFRIFVGKDQFYPAYNGYIADIEFGTCKGAYNEEFAPGVAPKIPKEKTLIAHTPTPVTDDPTCKPESPIKTDFEFDGMTKLVEVTEGNINLVIKVLEALAQEWKPERQCFCTLPRRQAEPHNALIELYGDAVQQYKDHPTIKQLISANKIRLRGQ